MAQKFGELDRYYDPGLTLTVLGREYTLPLPSAELGLWCRRIAQTAGEVDAASTDAEIEAAVERANARVEALPELAGDLTFPERVLGPVYAQMMADQVPDPYIQFCSATAYIWIIGGDDAAERHWISGGRPEARAPANRGERRAAKAGRTSTGAATATRTPASTSGTRSPKKSSGNGTAKASRGRKS